MVVPVDVPNDDPFKIEPPIVLPVLLLEDVHDSKNAKSENPPPPPLKIEIPLGDAKVKDALLLLFLMLFVLISENILPLHTSLQHIMICWSGFERKQGSSVFPLLLVNLITVEMEEAHLLL